MTADDGLRAWLVSVAGADDGRPDWHPPVVFDSRRAADEFVRDVRATLPGYRGRVVRVD